MTQSGDPFGFRFWLGWILSFAGAFVVSAVFWTWLISVHFGSLAEPELLVTWALSVFGCWFLILTPFMRKKEQIWKRNNRDQEKAINAWLAAMGSFIAALIGVSLFWSWKLRPEIETSAGFHPLWAKYVFASWLILILPFLIYLYKKADEIYKAAVARQTQLGPRFKTGYLDKSKRLLPQALAAKVQEFPETLKDGHIVELTLKDGRKVPHVFIFRGQEILGIYDAAEVTFESGDVADAALMMEIPAYEENRWLRLDGRA